MNRSRKVVVALSVLALVLLSCIGEPHAQTNLSSPEDFRASCASVRDCPPPKPSAGQDSRCLQAACSGNVCVSRVLTGTNLGLVEPGNFGCYAAPLICASNGSAIIDPNPSRQELRREGEVCVGGLDIPTCSIFRCRNKVCTKENNDGAACTNTPLNTCQKGVCSGGFCSAIADPQKVNVQCDAPLTNGCTTTEFRCASSGLCSSRNTVAAGKECAPNLGYNSNPTYLPPSFKSLFSANSSPPSFSCTPQCKLEYCGDGIVQTARGEECDGGAPGNANVVCSKCKVACAAGSSKDKIGTCCPSNQKNAEGYCCPGGKVAACGRCDGCQSCPTARCRYGGPYGWPMAHLGPGCAPASNWHVSGGCGACRVDFPHGAAFRKSELTAAPKSGWLYWTNAAGEVLTPTEVSCSVPCSCNNGAISCACSGSNFAGTCTGCVAFSSIGGTDGLAGINTLLGSGMSGNINAPYCVYNNGSTNVFCGRIRPTGQGCFDPNTEILLEEGRVTKARHIKIGDRVYNPLTQTSAPVARITSGPEREPMIELGFDGYLLKVTRTHPVLTPKGMKRAEHLLQGDSVFDAFGNERMVQYVRRAPLDPNQRVINFELETSSLEFIDRLVVGNNVVSGDLAVQNSSLEGE
jgi:hypothetical protein